MRHELKLHVDHIMSVYVSVIMKISKQINSTEFQSQSFIAVCETNIPSRKNFKCDQSDCGYNNSSRM